MSQHVIYRCAFSKCLRKLFYLKVLTRDNVYDIILS
nr:MAG TPA: hypothetical protein [Caudoviricetes sp.]